LKTVIFVAGITLLIAGAAEVMRCVVCIRTGEWLSRSGDVEELEQTLIQQHTEKASS
jgi:TRAP-type mannitol/chloroaromatic compound transport system permease small subunit